MNLSPMPYFKCLAKKPIMPLYKVNLLASWAYPWPSLYLTR